MLLHNVNGRAGEQTDRERALNSAGDDDIRSKKATKVKLDDDTPAPDTPAPAGTPSWKDEQEKQQELNKLKEEEVSDGDRQAAKSKAEADKAGDDTKYAELKAAAEKGTEKCQALKTTVEETPPKPAPQVFKELEECLKDVLEQATLLKFQNERAQKLTK